MYISSHYVEQFLNKQDELTGVAACHIALGPWKILSRDLRPPWCFVTATSILKKGQLHVISL